MEKRIETTDWYPVGSGNVNTTAIIRMARQFANMIRGKLNDGTVTGTTKRRPLRDSRYGIRMPMRLSRLTPRGLALGTNSRP